MRERHEKKLANIDLCAAEALVCDKSVGDLRHSLMSAAVVVIDHMTKAQLVEAASFRSLDLEWPDNVEDSR